MTQVTKHFEKFNLSIAVSTEGEGNDTKGNTTKSPAVVCYAL